MKKFLKLILIPFSLFFTSFTHVENMQNNPQVIILLGPPGSGKGTHAVEISKKLQIPHISTGDLFRENLRNKTLLGEKAKQYMDTGKLVPDKIVVEMLFTRIKEQDCAKGYILDGFPRTLEQAKALEEKLKPPVEAKVVNLVIKDELLIERVTGRVMCKQCGTPFHKKFVPPKKEGVCDQCGGELYQRKDDTEEVVKERLQAFHLQTEPLIGYYKKKGILCDVNAEGTKEQVFNAILSCLKAGK
jgi:adenylate kinase